MKTVEEIYREMAAAFAEATGTEVAGSGDLAARQIGRASCRERV